MIDAVKMLATPTTGEALPETLPTLTAAPTLTVAEPVTLQRAKDHLRVVVLDEDDYITSLITAARAMAEGRLNRTIVQRRRVAMFDKWRWSFALLKPPIISVDSIGYVDDTGAETTLDDTTYYLAPYDEDQVPQVELRYGVTYPALDRRRNPITVYYTAGYPAGEVPAPIVQWILLVIGTLYENRESVINGVTTFSLPDNFMAGLLQPYMVYE